MANTQTIAQQYGRANRFGSLFRFLFANYRKRPGSLPGGPRQELSLRGPNVGQSYV